MTEIAKPLSVVDINKNLGKKYPLLGCMYRYRNPPKGVELYGIPDQYLFNDTGEYIGVQVNETMYDGDTGLDGPPQIGSKSWLFGELICVPMLTDNGQRSKVSNAAKSWYFSNK